MILHGSSFFVSYALCGLFSQLTLYQRKQHNSPLLLYISSSVATGDFPSARENQQGKSGIQESPNQSHLVQTKICCIFIERCFRLSWINYSLESVCHI